MNSVECEIDVPSLVAREARARELLGQAWIAICFARQPDDEKAVAENRLLEQIEDWQSGGIELKS